MTTYRPSRFASFLLIAVLSAALFCACSHSTRIESFQVISTEWDVDLLEEMEREAASHLRADFKFNTAKTVEQQCRQIENVVRKGKVDLIIVNPFSGDAVVPFIEDAYDAGIKVVLVGQKVATNKYTAYVGPDNSAVGRVAAKHIVELLPDGGNIIEITSGRDADFIRKRIYGFQDVMEHFPSIKTVASFDAHWSSDAAHKGLDSLKNVLDEPVDLVFAFSDFAILGAIDSENFTNAKYVGIDGILDYGLKAVRDGSLDATVVNPTCGGPAIKTAVAILSSLPYDKDRELSPVLVTEANVVPVIESFLNDIDKNLQIDRLSDALLDYERGRAIPLIAALLLSLIILVLFIVLAQRQIKVVRANVDDVSRQLLETEKKCEELRRDNEVAEYVNKAIRSEIDLMKEASAIAPQQPVEISPDPVASAVFMNKFRTVVEEHIDNPDLSVEMIASELNLSRAQLYRKVKADTDKTPNELVLAVRLEKADNLLRSSSMNVSEVAYSVGFSSPSYFAKCYKDKFGFSPSEVK